MEIGIVASTLEGALVCKKNTFPWVEWFFSLPGIILRKNLFYLRKIIASSKVSPVKCSEEKEMKTANNLSLKTYRRF